MGGVGVSSRWGVLEPSASLTLFKKGQWPEESLFQAARSQSCPHILAKCLLLYASHHHAGHRKEFPGVKSVLVSFIVLATFLHGLKVALMSLSLSVCFPFVHPSCGGGQGIPSLEETNWKLSSAGPNDPS